MMELSQGTMRCLSGGAFMPKKTLIDELTYNLPKFKLCLVREGFYKKSKPVLIEKPHDAVKYLAPLSMACEEYFVAVHLNAKHEVLGVHEVSHGTLSASLVHPREVFKAALIANSFAILVCHNHPSGSVLRASVEDIDTTRQLVEAGRFMGVNVIDHLIIGPRSQHDWYSLRERHPELWAVELESA
jgi:DNA repair protein RadC